MDQICMGSPITLNTKFLNMFGLCVRAGRCVFGESACLSGIRSGKVFLVLADFDVTGNTRKRFENACTYRNVPLIYYERSVGDLARAAGKTGKKLFAIADADFAKTLLGLIQRDTNTDAKLRGVEK